jgi:hypothetical protein
MNNSSYFVLLIISVIIILVKSKNNCDFQICGTGFNIEFKGLVKDNKSTTFGDLYNYVFGNKNVNCVGEWIMKSTNNGSDYKFDYGVAISYREWFQDVVTFSLFFPIAPC